MPLCLRKTEGRSKDGSSSNKKNHDEKNKMLSGSKDFCGDSTRKRNDEKNSKQRSYVYRATKNMRSMHSSERIEEMVCELEGYRWDAILLSETWRQNKAEIWETHHKHISWEQENTTTNTALEYAEQEVEAKNCKRYIPIVGGVLNAELGPGYGVERTRVGPHTLNEGNKEVIG